jgi:hypothetical protein
MTWIPLGCNVFDCDTGDFRPAFIERAAMTSMGEGPNWIALDLAAFGPEILEQPLVVFEGLNRPGLNGVDFLGYCGTVANSPQDGVFVIFVWEPKGAPLGPVVFWAEWRTEDPARPGFPLGWQTDFRGVKHERRDGI